MAALTTTGCGQQTADDGDDQSDVEQGDLTGGIDAGQDDAAGDSGPVLDCPGGAWCECAKNDDCDQGLCVAFPSGNKCAQSCIQDCPKGYTCADVPVGSDLVQVCVAEHGYLCEPCTASDECAKAVGNHGSACIRYSEAIGSFCGPACKADKDCPGGYTCRASKTTDGADKKACVKTEGGKPIDCPCDARARALQLSTTCEATADKGVCSGTRVCGADGLGTCSASPTKEVCDGKDNDCNGATDDGLCNDSNPCTEDSCVVGPDGKPRAPTKCKFDANTAACDDNNACTSGDICAGSKCAGKTIDCDDNNGCTNDVCDPKTGCVHTQTKNACDDDNWCTNNDLCDGKGACVGLPIAASVACNDNNVCTKDGCDPKKAGKDGKTGCFSQAAPGTCEDGNPCTNGDTCKAGACSAGKNICSCTKDDDCKAKEDGDLCNGTLFCNQKKAPYFCEIDPKTLIKCDTTKDTTCISTVCDGKAGKCIKKPATEGKSCDADQSVCTIGDACKKGLCTKGKQLKCDDSNPCTDDSCHAKKGCQKVDNIASCEDGNKCTKGDTCAQGNCKPGPKLKCNDNEGCTFDFCDKKTGKCAHDGKSHDGDPCNADNSICTGPDVCKAGKCAAGKKKICDDGKPCTKDDCDPKQGCIAPFDNKAKCDADGKKCTPHDFCSNGVCKLGGPKNCSDGNTCTLDQCVAKDGSCAHPFAALNGEKCDADGSKCTELDKCKDGKCIAGAIANCDDKNQCTKDSCKPKSGCIHDKLTSTLCNDGDSCTKKDTCVAGKCGGIKLNCNDNNPCTKDECDAGKGCKYPASSDGTACGTGKHCVKAKCVVASCGDGYVAKGEECDDGNGAFCDGCEACKSRAHLVLGGGAYGRAAAKSPVKGGVAGPLSITTDLTLEAWIAPKSLSGQQIIIAKANKKLPQRIAYRFGIDAGKLFFAHSRGDVLEIAAPKNTGKAKLQPGVWSHVAAVVTGDILRIFINGQPAGATKLYKSRVDAPLADVTIGRAWSDAAGGELMGGIDAVHIAAAPLYGGAFRPSRRLRAARGTVSLWHMDRAVGGKIADEGSAGVSLALTKGASAAPKLGKDICFGSKAPGPVCGDGVLHAGFETCDDKNATLCDGCEGCRATNNFDVTAKGVLQTNPATEWATDILCTSCAFTLEAWVRPTDTKGIFEIVGTSCGMLTLALIQGPGGTRFGVVTHGSKPVIGKTPIKKNKWYHVAGIGGFYAGAPMRVYVNGKLDAEGFASYGLPSQYAQMHKEVMFIGAGSAGTGGGCVQQGQKPLYKNQFPGLIDEVRISVGQRYGQNFAPPRRLHPDAATRGLWHFDDPGKDVRDDSGRFVQATLVGGKKVADACFAESASSALCGDGQKAKWEACDNGIANGVAPKQCSSICTLNGKPDCSALKWAKNKVPTGKNVMTYAKQWTLEGWVRLPALPGKNGPWGPIVSVHANALCKSMAKFQHWYVGVGPFGDDASRLGGKGQTASPTRRVWKQGVWQHFALQYDGAGKGALWVDGALARSFDKVSSSWSASCSLNLGGFFDGNSYTLAAELASLRLSKRARYGHDFVPSTALPSDNDTTWTFDFDEGTGTSAQDVDGIFTINASKASWLKTGPTCAK